MNFKETEAYLLSLGNEVSTMKLGLDYIRRLLAELGDPQKKYLKVQVAGTNGKGSVCAFLSSICVTAGIRTGMFTSPHLVSMTERVKIDDVDINEGEFAALATRVREVSESLFATGEIDSIPTYFEQVTAIALLAFADANVELAILETGLGGRLDATTAANAEIAAITRIDLDHQQYLGDTIEEIAAEKAAIIHEGSEVVIGDQESEAMEVILERCRALGVGPILAVTGGNSNAVDPVSSIPDEFPLLGLPGRHQVENAHVAIAIAHVLREFFSISDDDIRMGLRDARHPGRLEYVGQFLFDGAHNIGGASALRKYLDEFIDRPITMIFGAMSDKDIGEIASILFPKANRLILTRPTNSRAAEPAEILTSVSETPSEGIWIEPNVGDALARARGVARDGDVILVTGSLYLVGEARSIISTGPFGVSDK